jgi:hypothetical protein
MNKYEFPYFVIPLLTLSIDLGYLLSMVSLKIYLDIIKAIVAPIVLARDTTRIPVTSPRTLPARRVKGVAAGIENIVTKIYSVKNNARDNPLCSS